MNSNDKIGDLELRLKMLQDENKALLKLASHDIRSPLNKLFALLNLLKMADEAPTEEQLGYIEKMELVLSDGLHRMRNLSELYAIENDSIKDLSGNVELQSLISRNLRDQKINAERKSISFKFISEPVTTQTDRLSVQRIFDQLISNAIKFTPTGKAIEVGLKMEESIVSISITDGGYGIREEEQKLLFQKFKVLSTPTTGGESKTGLGLFIAQWNAKNIGGKIIYENIGGSTFRIELPLIQLA